MTVMKVSRFVDNQHYKYLIRKTSDIVGVGAPNTVDRVRIRTVDVLRARPIAQ